MRTSLLFPCLFVFSIFACKKPKHLDSFTYPIILQTSLQDTLPSKAMGALKLDNVKGIKIGYFTGGYASYFEYEADRQSTLETISALSFSKRATISDTVCRRISHGYLALTKAQLSITELENSEFFWAAGEQEFDAYECIKGAFKHTLLISKNSKQIFHRIEFIV